MEKSGSSTTTTTAAAILSGMDTAKAKDILSADSLKPDVAGNILAKVDTQKAVGLLDSLSQDKTVAILNAMGGVVKNSYGLFGSRFGLWGYLPSFQGYLEVRQLVRMPKKLLQFCRPWILLKQRHW